MDLVVGMQVEQCLLKRPKDIMIANAGSHTSRVFTIGIDLMGADMPPNHILEAVSTLPSDFYEDVSLVLFATEPVLGLVKQATKHIPNISAVVCPDVVRMDDNPLKIIREKKQSSLLVGMHKLKEGSLSAFISCANTGALVAVARSELDALPGISRPALACTIPTVVGDIVLLDVGGNVEASTDMLMQFARLGSGYASIVHGVKRPLVALLNIGEEPLKGTQELKSAAAIFSDAPNESFDFVGNKEPYDVFTRQADVFVTNGFSGNLFIKTCEAMSRFILGSLQKKHPDISLSGIVGEGTGAQVLGVNDLVVKCHGAASISAIQQALLHTNHLLKLDFIPKLTSIINRK